jgi:hypothetical protein
MSPDHLAKPRSKSADKPFGEALDAVFVQHPTLRGYVTDELGNPRHHVAIFLDGSVLPRPKRQCRLPSAPSPRSTCCRPCAGG